MRTDWPREFIAKRRAGGLISLAYALAALDNQGPSSALGRGRLPFAPGKEGQSGWDGSGSGQRYEQLSSQDSEWQPYEGGSGEESDFDDPEAQAAPPDWEEHSGSSGAEERGPGGGSVCSVRSTQSGSGVSGLSSRYSHGENEARSSGEGHSTGSSRSGRQDGESCTSSECEDSPQLRRDGGRVSEGGSERCASDRGEGDGDQYGSGESGSNYSGNGSVCSGSLHQEPEDDGSSDGSNRDVGTRSSPDGLSPSTLRGVQWGLNPLVSGRTMTPSMQEEAYASSMHPLIPVGTMSPQQLATSFMSSEAARGHRGGHRPNSQGGSIGEWDKFRNPLQDDPDP